MEYLHVEHPFEPVFDENAKLLILGSFPSVKSRENMFYYGHPRNRFWKVLACIFSCAEPVTVEEKRVFLLSHGIALWDVIASCDIEGSADATIRNAVPNRQDVILRAASVRTIFANGDTAYRLFMKLSHRADMPPVVKLPSTSPANAAWSTERLTEYWGRQLMSVWEQK